MNKFQPQQEMTPSPDKQFRESLEHYKKSPPQHAWGRIETGLHKNKNRGIRYGAAAAVILLIGATFMLLRSNDNRFTNPPITRELYNDTSIEIQTPASKPINDPIASVTIESASVPSTKSNKIKSSKKDTPDVIEETNSMIAVSNIISTETSTSGTVAPEIVSTTSQEPVSINDVASSSTRSNKIVYSSGEVNSRFLKKETEDPVPVKEKASEATPEKPQTPIQKIIDIASNLKYEENALGELREKKNEILSLPRRDAKNK